MCCGQVFKLIRLRQDANQEDSYYGSSLIDPDFDEMGESDMIISHNPLKAILPHTYEPSMMETRKNNVYTLMNPDDHDHYLVDPAYRMERNQKYQNLIDKNNEIFSRVDQEYLYRFDSDYKTMNKHNYENLVNAELIMEEQNDHIRKIQYFNLRSILDPLNHQRREKRMIERAEGRLDNTTIYVNSSEEQLQYEDYFETDVEIENKKGAKNISRKLEILQDQSLDPKKINFEEKYTNSAEHDASSIIQQKIFRFRYRAALYSIEDHMRKENRMMSRMPAIQTYIKKYQQISGLRESINRKQKEMEFYEDMLQLTIDNYKNYFESDLEEDFDNFESLPIDSKIVFMNNLQNEVFEEIMEFNKSSHYSFKRDLDPEEGLISNSIKNLRTLVDTVVPKYTKMENLNFEDIELQKEVEDKKSRSN